MDAQTRQLSIKTGVLKRLVRENEMYREELTKQMDRIDSLKKTGVDNHVIAKEKEVLDECNMMIFDSRRRMMTAYEDLDKLLNEFPDLRQSKFLSYAMEVVESAKDHLSSFPSISNF